MFRKCHPMAFIALSFAVQSAAQTTTGLITGTVTDSSGAVIAGADIGVTNEGTKIARDVTTDTTGFYIVPQLEPGLYSVTIKKQGFTTETRTGVTVLVNKSTTLDSKLTVSATLQSIQVTAAPPALNTTSATLGDVVEHQSVVDLPLNGRQFTQLTLLTPGAAPVENFQQTIFNVALGAGGIDPSVDGQRGEMNNFTMDGLLNNELFTDSWLISPPPDALQEFNVQSHMTDAQFGMAAGANINVATRSGTNAIHGSVWEFNRNAAVEARNFFATNRLPYNQNQYGVYVGGPVYFPHVYNGKNKSWFSFYWKGFRSIQSFPEFANVLTADEQGGNFSDILGTQVVGMDSLGRPEYQNEIYDPTTGRPDPSNPSLTLRDPFPGNMIPPGDINPDAPIILKQYYPLPNLNVPAGVFPNYAFSGKTATRSDTFGVRLDHHITDRDTVFVRYNHSLANLFNPEPTPGYSQTVTNYGEVAAFGYTHLFGPSSVLNARYGYSAMTLNYFNSNPGPGFNPSLNYLLNTQSSNPTNGPSIAMANGFSGVNQYYYPLGPDLTNEYNVDLTTVKGHHTISAGAMMYHINSFGGGTATNVYFAQNATAQDGTAGPTGNGGASFMLDLIDSVTGYAGSINLTDFETWWAFYGQDQWKVTKKLTVTAGLRWDDPLPPGADKVLSGFDFLTGQWHITRPFLPLFPKALGPSTYYYNQANGWEPRLGIAYRALDKTVVRAGWGIFDDANRMVQVNMGTLSASWPTATTARIENQNHGLPTTYLNNLPSLQSFENPLDPIPGQSPDPNSPNVWAMEYNLTIEQELPHSIVLSLGYVGASDHNLFLQEEVNGAQIPGPGPLASRGQPYPQYTSYPFDTNAGHGLYNALQVELRKAWSSGISYRVSYTWSKTLDTNSDPYANGVQNWYDQKAEWGPADFNVPQVFVLSGTYALPVGHEKHFLSDSHGIVNAVVGNWNTAAIISLRSGLAFECLAGGDVANVSQGTQRCDEIGPRYSKVTPTQWLNPASFTTIPYTWGTESRNDMIGPGYHDVDFSLFKTFPVFKEKANFQIRADFFNLFNDVNFGLPANGVTNPAFGLITSAGFPREIQFAAKFTF